MKTKLTAILLVFLAWNKSSFADLPGYFAEALKTKLWVAYSPTGSSSTPANEGVIREDLQVLHNAGFSGIITYGCDGLKKNIPKIAKEVGIPHVILGIYDPTRRDEMDNAKALAGSVDAYCVGNEGLLEAKPRYTLDQLKAAMTELRQWSGRPVTTSEQVDDYYDKNVGAELLELGDWVFPNIHPFWHDKTSQIEAAEWTRSEYERLVAAAKGRIVICKEVGLPTGNLDQEIKEPDERAQAEYYSAIRTLRVQFAYFEAFDQVWKRHHPVEPFWGLFDKDRKPKLAVVQLGKLASGVQIESPASMGKIKVRMASRTQGPGFFDAHGTMAALGDDRELVLFVNTGDRLAPGWFMQVEPNGIFDLDDGKWSVTGQLGNEEYPPRNGQRISLRVLGVSRTEAAKLRQIRISNEAIRNQGIMSQDLPKPDAQWRADAKDVEVELQFPGN